MPDGTFTGPLRLEEIGYELWFVIDPFSFISRTGIRVDIDAGFITDLASVPQMFRSLVPKIGYWSQAAVIHDRAYRSHREGLDTTLTRLQVDRMFREAAKVKALEYGVPDSKRREWQLYHAVRGFSLPYWETPEERTKREADENAQNDFLDG